MLREEVPIPPTERSVTCVGENIPVRYVDVLMVNMRILNARQLHGHIDSCSISVLAQSYQAGYYLHGTGISEPIGTHGSQSS